VEFPAIQYKHGGDGTVFFESFGEKGDRHGSASWVAPGFALVVSAKTAMRLVVQAPFYR
jgi:hypothetical protein